MMRRLLLAALLALSLTPAFGQVAPPVPALPDTERRTSYSITASTCACAVGFQLYGDSTDYANWLEVFVNGVMITQAGNWTITSPTGSLATIPRPITDAVLTFTVAQTGTVQIVGARRPRRTSQFQENQPVPTRNFNQIFSDLTAQNREVWDKINDVTGRSVRTPPGETLALLPVLASRANMGACFDSGGNLTSCVAVSGSFAAGNGILFTGTNPTTITNNIQAGAGISLTGTNPIIIKSSGANGGAYVLPSDYSFTCDGVTNVATAFQSMVTGSTGKTIFIPPGPACVVGTTITLPASTTIIGGGWDSSVKCSVVNNPCFSTTDASDVVLSNFFIQGSNNSTGWASASNFGALSVSVTAGAGAVISNIQFTKMKVSGFNSTYWIWINIANAGQILQDIKFDENYINSDNSSIPGDAAPVNNGNYGIAFFGGTTQSMRRASFSRNKILSAGICFPIIMFGNVSFANLDGNEIDSPGQTNSGHCISGTGTINAYGIAVYDLYSNGNTASSYSISNNIINAPYASGIYVVGNSDTNSNAVIASNVITGQTSTDNSQLPRGAIAINGASNMAITGNVMNNGFGGINIASINKYSINISGNICYTSNGSGSSYCYRQTPPTGASNTDSVNIVSNSFYTDNAASTIILVGSVTGNRFNDVRIANNYIRTTSGIGISAASQFISGQFTIANDTFIGAGTPTSISSITGNLVLTGNMGLSFTAATLPAAVNGSSVFVSDGAPASACTGASTGSNGYRQNGAWKCF